MTNKFYRKDAIINVYVANLEKYEDGNLIGDWVSLPIKKKDFRDFLKTIGNPQRIGVHDYYESNSSFNGLRIADFKGIEELNEVCKRMERLDTCEVDIFNAIYEVSVDFKTALDCLESENYGFYEDKTIEEVAREHLEKYFDIPPFLEKHIDYSGLADDMRAKGYYETSRGVIYTQLK